MIIHDIYIPYPPNQSRNRLDPCRWINGDLATWMAVIHCGSLGPWTSWWHGRCPYTIYIYIYNMMVWIYQYIWFIVRWIYNYMGTGVLNQLTTFGGAWFSHSIYSYYQYRWSGNSPTTPCPSSVLGSSVPFINPSTTGDRPQHPPTSGGMATNLPQRDVRHCGWAFRWVSPRAVQELHQLLRTQMSSLESEEFSDDGGSLSTVYGKKNPATLTGWWLNPTPLKNIKVSWDYEIPNRWKTKTLKHDPCPPWCWTIYLQNWAILRANVGHCWSIFEHHGAYELRISLCLVMRANVK